MTPNRVQGGPAVPVKVATTGPHVGGPAIPVYLVQPGDGYNVQGGPAMNTYLVTDPNYPVAGGPALPISYVAPSGTPNADGGPAVPISCLNLAALTTVMGGGAANKWWLSRNSDTVLFGGLATFAPDGALGSGTGANGRTYIHTSAWRRIRQNGTVTRAKVLTSGQPVNVKIKIFRDNGDGTYNFVSESALLAATAGTNTFNLATPIACAMGDVVGVWIAGHNPEESYIGGASIAGDTVLYLDNTDVTGNNVTFTSTVADFGLDVEVDGQAPFLVVTGDSIPEGNSEWHTFYNTTLGISGDITYEVPYQLRQLVGDSTELTYQNHSYGSQHFSWVQATGLVSALAAKPKAIIIHAGVNDIDAGDNWAHVLPQLNSIRATVPQGVKLFISEILPWTNGTDVEVATVRTWNTNLAAWCAANVATLILCHDAMGQIRVSTGELDDLLAAYDHDGVHLSVAGATKLAEIWKAALDTANWAEAPSLAYASKIKSLFGANLIGYWPLNETIGATAADDSGNGRDGAYVNAPTLGQVGIGDGETAPLFNGTDEYVNIYTAGLAGAFKGDEGSMMLWAKVANAGVWADGTLEWIMDIRADSPNRVPIYKAATGEITGQYVANSTAQSLAHTATPTGFFHFGVTWSKSNDRMRIYYNGIQSGANQTGLGVWAGAPAATTCTVGCYSTTPSFPFPGYCAHALVLDREATPAEMLIAATV